MAISLPGFNAEYFYRVLSQFWKDYKQRDQLATVWGGLSQIVENEYLQLYQADFSKSLENVPVYWRYQWVNLVFTDWISNEVPHEHQWYERVTTAINERSTGELVVQTGYMELNDSSVDFVVSGIRAGHIITIDSVEYPVTSVVPYTITFDASLPAVTNVTYTVGEKVFNMAGPVTHASYYTQPSFPEGNIYNAVATEGQTELELPFPYDRGDNELTVGRNTISQVVDEDYIEVNSRTIRFIPALAAGDNIRVEKEYLVRVISAILNGVYLTEGVDFELDGTDLVLTEPLLLRTDDGQGHNMMIKWEELTTPVPHSHRQFEEILAAPKDTWTNAVGDAFEPGPEGQGPYQFGDINAPLELWVNGAKQIRDFQAEPNSVTLIAGEALEAGDRAMLRWIRNDADPEQHKHLRYTKVLSAPQQSFELPFSIDFVDNIKHTVYINGTIQTINEHYDILGAARNLISFDEDLLISDVLEVEYYKHEYLYKHEIDPLIYSAPIIQDGIDLPTIISIQLETHEIKEGWLFCDYDFDEIWIPNLFVNEPTTENNFGDPIGFNRPNSQSYLNSVRGLWFCHWNGPAFKNIEIGSKILMGVPFAPKTAQVQRRLELESGEDVVLELEGDLNYTIMEPLKPIVNAGDTVPAYHPLANGVEVWDYVSNPEWYKNFPGLYLLWSEFSVDGEPYTGFWDDRGFLDDGGFFDDGSPGDPTELDDFNKMFFDLIKWFIFIVNVDASLLNESGKIDDVIFYLDTIKPAYTKYFINVELPGTDDICQRRATDELTFEADLDPFEDEYRLYFDDGGFMDFDEGGRYVFTGTFGQTEVDLPWAYRFGMGTLQVRKDNVLQIAGVDYQEIHGRRIDFLVSLLGTEYIDIFEDDSTLTPFDKNFASDEVTFTLV